MKVLQQIILLSYNKITVYNKNKSGIIYFSLSLVGFKKVISKIWSSLYLVFDKNVKHADKKTKIHPVFVGSTFGK